MGIPVFVINLQRSGERRDHTTQQLNNLGLHFQIVEAIDGTELSDNKIRNNPDFGIYKFGMHSRYLLKEEIGCTLTHLKIFRKMVDEKIELACILEDDNDYTNDFKDILENIRSHSSDWDLLYLGHRSGPSSNEAQSRKKRELKPFNHFIGEAVEVPYGSHAYIINSEAAKKLLGCAYPINMPFDSFIGKGSASGIRTFLLSPPCVTSNTVFNSTIYTDQDILYSTPFWKFVGHIIGKIYLWFPFLRILRVWIFMRWNSILVHLRKTGMIKNFYSEVKI
jgi:glycosyl transferase, family 25